MYYQVHHLKPMDFAIWSSKLQADQEEHLLVMDCEGGNNALVPWHKNRFSDGILKQKVQS